MKKQNLLKSLILVISVLISTVGAFAATSVQQTLSVSAEPTVAIEKTSYVQSGQINPETGVHSGLNASFSLQTNGTDDDYTFVVGSSIISAGNVEVSAFSDDGQAILFGRANEEEYLPTLEAIQDAKAGGNNNPNVIAYPIASMTIDSPMTVEFVKGLSVSENLTDCYQVKLNGGTEATLRQVIGGSPIPGTYMTGPDKAGSYRAVVYFTAISK